MKKIENGKRQWLFVGGNVLIEQCRSGFHCDSDCHPFIHYCFKWEIKHNLPYMKEIGIENIKRFQDLFFSLQDSSNEIS